MATLEQRLAQAEAEAAEAEKIVNDPEFVEREQMRKRIAEAGDRKREALARRRDSDLAARIDFWRDVEGVGEVVGVLISEKPHAFVVTGGGASAYKTWQRGLQDAAMSKLQKGTRQKVDEDEVSRAYAVAGILDWNGKIVDDRGGDVDSEIGKALNDLLRREPGIVTEILNRVSRLDGAAAEDRKS